MKCVGFIKALTNTLIVVLMAVQELCRDPHGVLAFIRESSGCVWQALHPASRRRLRCEAIGHRTSETHSKPLEGVISVSFVGG